MCWRDDVPNYRTCLTCRQKYYGTLGHVNCPGRKEIMTTQFKGESNWDAIVNDNSLDIEEEQEFLEWLEGRDRSKESPLEELQAEFDMWDSNR